MDELISKKAAIDALENDKEVLDQIIRFTSANDAQLDHYVAQHNQVVYDIDVIKQLPPIQPKRGRWIRTGSGSLYDHYECSECGKAPKWECMGDNRWKIAFTDFCPNCGCRMDGGE